MKEVEKYGDSNDSLKDLKRRFASFQVPVFEEESSLPQYRLAFGTINESPAPWNGDQTNVCEDAINIFPAENWAKGVFSQLH